MSLASFSAVSYFSNASFTSFLLSSLGLLFLKLPLWIPEISFFIFDASPLRVSLIFLFKSLIFFFTSLIYLLLSLVQCSALSLAAAFLGIFSLATFFSSFFFSLAIFSSVFFSLAIFSSSFFFFSAFFFSSFFFSTTTCTV